MQKITFFFMLMCVKLSFGQLREDFSGNSFLTWQGAGNFLVESGQLRTAVSRVNTNFYFSTPNQLAIDCVWEFWIQLKFNTSGSNFVDVYLVSNQENLQNASIQGYFLRVGGTADELALYKRNGSLSSATKIIDGVNGTTNSSNTVMKIKVVRDVEGTFQIFYDKTGTGTQYIADGEVLDATFTKTAFFGVYVQQSTATFHGKHYLDDLLIDAIQVDKEPPSLRELKVLTDSSWLVTYSEAVVEETALDISNYQFVGAEVPEFKVEKWESEAAYVIVFKGNLPTDTYSLKIKSISDLAGNLLKEAVTTTLFHVAYYVAQKMDIRINEVMIDPSPPQGLYNGEYIELWNQTNQFMLLKGWKLKVQQTIVEFPADTLMPGNYLLLTSSLNAPHFEQFGKVLSFKNWPALRNESGRIAILGADDVELDTLLYEVSFYKDKQKMDGGFSLELIHPLNPCDGRLNWRASENTAGGTPGKVNSVYGSHYLEVAPQLNKVFLKTSNSLELSFSNPIRSDNLLMLQNYHVNNGIGFPIEVNILDADFTKVEILFNQDFRTGIKHRVSVSGMLSCGGKQIDMGKDVGEFFRSKKIVAGDLLITELLMNPKLGGADFLELYNASSEVLNLSGLSIANADKMGNPDSRRYITEEILLLEPGAYLVLTPDVQVQKTHYYVPQPEALVLFPLPAFTLEQGGVFLLSGDILIDHLSYKSSFHHPLMANVKGVSLERRSLKIPSNVAGNFGSASGLFGYATPGFINSNMGESEVSYLRVNEPILYVNEGVEWVNISFGMVYPNSLGTLHVLSDKGKLVKTLFNNEILGKKGAVKWDGKDKAGAVVARGIYHILLDAFNLNGKRERLRTTVVVAK